MIPLGDIPAGQTIRFKWPTADANGASAAPSPAGNVRVYKDDGTTASIAGVTDTRNFNSLTGVHHCTVATTDGFYTPGSDFEVLLEGAEIGGEPIDDTVARFSIARGIR